jgi:hypothetical protein
MAGQGIKNPACMTRMLAPRFPHDHVVLKTRTMQI